MTRIVAYFEFMFTIKSKVYAFITFGIPIIFLTLGAAFAFLFGFSESNVVDIITKPIAVVDESAILAQPESALYKIPAGEIYLYEPPNKELLKRKEAEGKEVDYERYQRRVIKYESLQKALKALEQAKVRIIVVIKKDYIDTADISLYRKRGFVHGIGGIHPIEALLNETLIKQSNIPPQQIKRIQAGAYVTDYEVGDDRSISLFDSNILEELPGGVPLGISVVLIMALMINAGLLVSSVVLEKENRVIEIILSSVTPEELLFGKVIGIIAAGLLQMAVWLIMVGAVPVFSLFVLGEEISLDLNAQQMGLALLFGVLGLLFYGLLFAGLGSLGSTERDSRHLSTLALFFAGLPLALGLAFVIEPNGILARVFSFIPFFSPSAMILRVIQIEVPPWEIALSLLILVGSIWLAIKVAAQIFRIGMLMYGKEVTLRTYYSALRGSFR